ncbi:MAG: hypothetical protein QXE90_03765 [Candidatus Micrarchaeia archaeon]
MQKRSEKSEKLWKFALMVIIAGILVYLLQQIISDPRWIFSENSTFIVLAVFILAFVAYLLKKRKDGRR